MRGGPPRRRGTSGNPALQDRRGTPFRRVEGLCETSLRRIDDEPPSVGARDFAKPHSAESTTDRPPPGRGTSQNLTTQNRSGTAFAESRRNPRNLTTQNRRGTAFAESKESAKPHYAESTRDPALRRVDGPPIARSNGARGSPLRRTGGPPSPDRPTRNRIPRTTWRSLLLVNPKEQHSRSRGLVPWSRWLQRQLKKPPGTFSKGLPATATHELQ